VENRVALTPMPFDIRSSSCSGGFRVAWTPRWKSDTNLREPVIPHGLYRNVTPQLDTLWPMWLGRCQVPIEGVKGIGETLALQAACEVSAIAFSRLLTRNAPKTKITNSRRNSTCWRSDPRQPLMKGVAQC
jgi:hypothetical protein